MNTEDQIALFRNAYEALRAEIGKVIVGHHEIVEGTLQAIFGGGHVLLEGVPGLGKTLLVRTLSEVLDMSFNRIQFTPDLMPADILGTNIVMEVADGRREFQYQRGPIFAHLVLADEINRATPKTQSAMLEAMQEKSVTAGGEIRKLAEPFFVLATQNPIDQEGTYPLPEAQLDRFLVRLRLGYPRAEAEIAMLLQHQLRHPIDDLKEVATAQDVLDSQRAVRAVHVDEKVARYVVQLAQATRDHPDLSLGASPRACLALVRCAQAFAAVHGFDFALPDDVKEMLPHVLGHRLILRPESRLRKKTIGGVLGEILNTVPVPTVTAIAPRR